MTTKPWKPSGTLKLYILYRPDGEDAKETIGTLEENGIDSLIVFGRNLPREKPTEGPSYEHSGIFVGALYSHHFANYIEQLDSGDALSAIRWIAGHVPGYVISEIREMAYSRAMPNTKQTCLACFDKSQHAERFLRSMAAHVLRYDDHEVRGL